MRRIKNRGYGDPERGVTAVIIAICAAVLFGVCALVIDVGAARQERRELQNGADAGALALAQDCALGSCTNLNATATNYANLNSNDGLSRATASLVGSNSVRVITRTSDAGANTDGDANTIDYNWAPILGGPSGGEVTATATAVWGNAGSGTDLALAFSKCEWDLLTVGGIFSTTPRVIFFHDPAGSGNGNGNGNGNPGATQCTAPAGQDTDGDSNLNGGFGWLNPSSGCQATVNAAGWVASSPGASAPNTCSPTDLRIGQEVGVPIFDDVIDNNEPGWANQCSTNKCYHVYGVATIKITGFQLGGNGNEWTVNPPQACSPQRRCIAGYFVKFTLGFAGGPIVPGPDLGTYVVRLTE